LSERDRIKKERVPIDYSATQAFFDERGRHDYASPLSATMYQDNNPQLVEQRDAAEKAVLAPFLQIKPASAVLDIGCGVGRWGWHLAQQVPDVVYNGIDFSASLVDKALQEAQRLQLPGLNFQVMSAIAIEPGKLLVKPPYELLLISGLLIYLNDEDCIKVLHDAFNLCAVNGLIYIREPVGVSDRFTLNKFYSTELSHEYSAIYRTIEELQALFAQAFPGAEIEPVVSDYLFPESLEKRAETRQYYTVLRRRG
jgi:SAM-dependent methyltransferase